MAHACTDACRAAPECSVCGLRKPPIGRSVALEMANGMCGYDCAGYSAHPRPGHLWPGEECSGPCADCDAARAAREAE